MDPKNVYPAMFLNSATGLPAEKCDGCTRRFEPTTPYLVVKVMTRIGVDRCRKTRHEVALCETCYNRASARLSPPLMAKLMKHVDEKMIERAQLSDLRDASDYLRTMVNRRFDAEDIEKVSRHLQICRFCCADTLNVREDRDEFVHAAVFRGRDLVVKTGRYFRFELPLTLCDKCDSEAAAHLHELQPHALDFIYAELDVDDFGFRPLLPFLAENPLDRALLKSA